MQNHCFVAVAKPHGAEGIGRALQVIYRDGRELPSDMRNYLERLDRISF